MIGCSCETTVAWRDDRVVGLLPAMSVTGPLGTVLNSLPFFGSNGGVLAAEADVAATLRAVFDARVRECSAATWISNPFLDIEPPIHDAVDERISQWTDLADWDATADLPRGLEGSARRNVTKAVSEGITVRETPDELALLENLHRANMSSIGGRQKPPEFFEAVARALAYGRDWTMYV